MGYVYKEQFDGQYINTSQFKIAGIVDVPTFSFSGGNIDISACTVVLNSEIDGTGTYGEHSLTNDTFAVSGEWTNNYIIADYNSGSPILDITTDVNDINGYSVVGLFTVVKNDAGNVYRCTKWENIF